MKPMVRSSRGTKILDHENRVQTLERRIPEDYPHWYGQTFAQKTNINNAGGAFSFAFGDECPDDPVECEADFVTDGDYILFPTGHAGGFHVYMNVWILGGFTNVDDAYTATVLGADTPSKKFKIGVTQEVWRDNAPFGSVSTWAFVSEGEILASDSDAGNGQGRLFWLHWIGSGSGILVPETDRRALKFTYSWGHAADITFAGNVNVAIDPNGQMPGSQHALHP